MKYLDGLYSLDNFFGSSKHRLPFKAVHWLRSFAVNRLVPRTLLRASPAELALPALREEAHLSGEGVNTDDSKPRVIITLTTYPKRISTVHLTIRSLMLQQPKPDAIVLYLDIKDFPQRMQELPDSLLQCADLGLKIHWCDGNLSYDKLIPALVDFPRDILITVDDDIFYPSWWLSNLLSTHVLHPRDIVCHRAHRITLQDGEIAPYLKWQRNVDSKQNAAGEFTLLFTGCGGVLYPPGALHSEVRRREQFAKLAPRADDLWFFAMAVKQQTRIRVCEPHLREVIDIASSQSESLYQTNKLGGNDVQLAAILDDYPEVRETIVASLREEEDDVS